SPSRAARSRARRNRFSRSGAAPWKQVESWSRRHWFESTGVLGIDFLALERAVGAVHKPAIRPSGALRVECDHRQRALGVGLPLVDFAVTSRVLFGARQHAALEILPARYAAVAARGPLDSLQRLVGTRLVGGDRRPVVLPPIDPAVLVLVHLDPDDPRSVH